MYFTQEDYRKIESWLQTRVVKDTQFPKSDPVTGKELVPIIQDNTNKVITLYNLIKQVTNVEPYDFYNVSTRSDKARLSLKEAVNSVPLAQRKLGLVITFRDKCGNWNIYQFRGTSINQWQSLTYWEDIISDTIKNYIDTHIYYPDEEDITSVDEDGRHYLKFKDRIPEEDDFVSTGTIILRKNIVVDECDTNPDNTARNILTQDMINEENVIYVIQYDFDLDDKIISIPDGSTLWFQGGSLNNGHIYIHETAILGAYEFADMGEDLVISGKFKTGQIMTFLDDSYEAKDGKYFIKKKEDEEYEGVLYDINSDAYVTESRQRLKWWNGKEWVWILDITDYNELKSIINELIEKHNIEIANLYKYFEKKIGDISEEINKIWVKIGDIEIEIGNIKTEINNIWTEIEEIKVEINNINSVINNLEVIINSIFSNIALGLIGIKDSEIDFVLISDDLYVPPVTPPEPPDPDEPDPDNPDNPDDPDDNQYCYIVTISPSVSVVGGSGGSAQPINVSGTFEVTWECVRHYGHMVSGSFVDDGESEVIDTDVVNVACTSEAGYASGTTCKPNPTIVLQDPENPEATQGSAAYQDVWGVTSAICTAASIGWAIAEGANVNNSTFTTDGFDEEGNVWGTLTIS